MEYRQIEHLITLVEEGSFTKAAERLNVSQPNLSMSIRRLEKELGVTIVQRTLHESRLTAIGEIFYREACKSMKILREAKKTIQDMKQGLTGEITIGYVQAALDGNLFNAIHFFKKKYPSIHLNLQEMTSRAQFQAIHNKHIDIGFLYPEQLPLDRRMLAVELNFQENYCLALHEDDPMCKRLSLTLRQLKNQPLMIPSRYHYPDVYLKLLELCRIENFEPQISREYEDKQHVLSLISLGMGKAIVPSALRQSHRKAVIYRSIHNPLLNVEIFMVWRHSDSRRITEQFTTYASAFPQKSVTIQ